MTTVTAICPACGAVIPTFDVQAKAHGFWPRKVEVFITGDATDWVAHLWQHREEPWVK
jgi:hypothetical protein